MPLKKQNFSVDEMPMFDDAVIYKRGDYWHFRKWLKKQARDAAGWEAIKLGKPLPKR